jgi:hypothetical protein
LVAEALTVMVTFTAGWQAARATNIVIAPAMVRARAFDATDSGMLSASGSCWCAGTYQLMWGDSTPLTTAHTDEPVKPNTHTLLVALLVVYL